MVLGGIPVELLAFHSLYFLFSIIPFLEADETIIIKGCIKRERDALYEFKQPLVDPSGRLSTWTGEDCCKWAGVSCNNKTGNVFKLVMRNKDCYIEGEDSEGNRNSLCLSGKISPSLSFLEHLEYLDLSMNNFQSNTIPEFFGSLKHLSYLDLSYSRFGGLVPPNLGNLSNLQYLDLGSNFAVSNQPSIWISDLNWISHLSRLEYLNLGFVNLSLTSTHWLQALNKLPSLSKLYLEFCGLQSMPSTLPEVNFTSLTVVDLSNNNFLPSVPKWLFNHSNLVMLDLSYNDIRGDIGGLIDVLCQCCNDSLQELYLASDQMSGKLPGSLGFFRELKQLYVSDNSISGEIPESIGSLLNIESVDLSYNNMSGHIPLNIGKLTNLVSLYLFQNSWEGVLLQDHFHGLGKLEYFEISSTRERLIFNMSDNWHPPFSLKFIRISNCQLGPRFPSWFKTQKQLSRIHLTNVGVSDTIPDWFWQSSTEKDWLDFSNNDIKGVLPSSLEFPPEAIVDLSFNRLEGSLPLWYNLPYLNLANNLLTGSIPSQIGEEMPLLKFLNLSGNYLSGSIPSSIGEMKNLQRLDLSDNRLSGKIHDLWKHSQELIVLDLSMNNFSGNIPNSLFTLPKLQWLKLDGNKLSGGLSFPWTNCTNLILLDLGDNELAGEVPKWIGEKLSSLSELKLRSNMFRGNIHQELCNLSNLHILDLADNDLSGKIPSCLGNLSSFRVASSNQPISTYQLYPFIPQMELVVKGRKFTFSNILDLVNSIDLSGNDLIGEIPEGITNLLILGTLNLSHNRLTGKVPEDIGNLRRLETLDLSFNQLSGSIPLTMSFMTLLNHLNLSYNNFSGPIPSTNQFLTFNDPSIYEGNIQLCGDPIPKNCSKDNASQAQERNYEDGEDKLGLYVSIGLGFVFGYLGSICSLVMKKSWRCAYFNSLDKLGYLFTSKVPNR